MVGILTTMCVLASLLGIGPDATTSATASLALGTVAVSLGGVGLYQCSRGRATNWMASGWAVGLGMFGALPTVAAVVIFAS